MVDKISEEENNMDIRDEVLRLINAYPRKLLELEADIQKPLVRHLGANWEKYGGYKAFAEAIQALEKEILIKPIKAQGLNGRNPPLFLRYRKLPSQQHDYEKIQQEILSIYRSQIDLSHFLAFPQEYPAVRDVLLAVDHYLLETRDKPPRVLDTVNERSFMLTGEEKYLASSAGRRLLKLINIDLASLYCTLTPEPFFYWATAEPYSTDCLIVENKDAFYAFKKLIAARVLTISPPVRLLIYGEGKKILSSWPFIFECLPQLKIRFFYFGDLDPEGAAICGDLIRSTASGKDDLDLIVTSPALSLYTLLLEKGKKRVLGKDQSNVSNERLEPFFQCFHPEFRERVTALWGDGMIIPQEAIPASMLALKGRVEL